MSPLSICRIPKLRNSLIKAICDGCHHGDEVLITWCDHDGVISSYEWYYCDLEIPEHLVTAPPANEVDGVGVISPKDYVHVAYSAKGEVHYVATSEPEHITHIGGSGLDNCVDFVTSNGFPEGT